MKEIIKPSSLSPPMRISAPVVIWNINRRCNLACRHCYLNSYDFNFSGEFTTNEAFKVIDDLANINIPALIISGGEPLLRNDIFTLLSYAKDKGLYVGLSSNGTLINKNIAKKLSCLHLDYIGISIDGDETIHDMIRGKTGSYQSALYGLRLCNDYHIKTGIRFTLTKANSNIFTHILSLIEKEHIQKFYLSHLNYSGRGNRNKHEDSLTDSTKNIMNILFETCLHYIKKNDTRDFVTGNNDADAVFLLQWIEKYYPDHFSHIERQLIQWGGNASGKSIANIDSLGNVHPDTYWNFYSIGNVRQKPFSKIWNETDDPLMRFLRTPKRTINGKCSQCRFFSICNGNTRTRAYQISKDYHAEDPGCYIDNSFIYRDNTVSSSLSHVSDAHVSDASISQHLYQEDLV